jgi:hypothetical protein
MRLGDISLRTFGAQSLAGLMTGAAALALSFAATAQTIQPVLQRGYDAGVTGATLTETALNTSNVVPGSFGMVFTLPVDDNILAQPLYVPNLVIPGQGTHNVVYVATMSDTVYAFDADIGGLALWSANFASLVGATPVPIAKFVFAGNKNIIGNLGILSTPVIDESTDIMYLVACTLENNTMVYRLHAVDITTGSEPYGPGVLISAAYGTLTFDAIYQLQRSSLTLSGNQVVIAFSAVEKEAANTYAGWVLGYNKQTLVQNGAFASVTTGDLGGGVWQSGRPPVVDNSGYVYVFTGNSYGCCGYDGVNNFAESALKLDPANGMSLVSSFTPSNWSNMDLNDSDLSSSGPLLIPDTNPALIAGGGKTQYLYVLDTAKLGGFNSSDSQIVQKEAIASDQFRGGPVYWQRSAENGGPMLYNWGVLDSVKAYPFTGTQFATSPSAQGSGMQIWPGGILALSAYGDQPDTGVLWATVATSGDDEDNPPVPGELIALDANNVATQLWNSNIDASRDSFGNFGKLVPPMIANGKVYVATWSNQVAVYGLMVAYTVSPTAVAFGSQTVDTDSASVPITVTNTGSAALAITSITISGANVAQFSQTNTCGGSLAAGATCTISAVFKPTLVKALKTTILVNAGSAGTQTVALSGTGIASPYTVSPSAVAFGNETVGVASAPAQITVTNIGSTALAIASITILNKSQFTQTNTCGSSLAVGGTCTISVVFKPTVLEMLNTELLFNAGSAGTQSVALSGSGVASPYTVSPSSVAFGSETTSLVSAPAPITATNPGSAALAITSITISGANIAQFSQTNTCGSSIAAGGTCTISAVFQPTVVGALKTTVLINAGSAGTQSVALSGTGVAPPYTVSPSSIAFGSETTGVATAPVPITVTNTGGTALPLTSIAISGSNKSQFSQTNNCGSSIAAGGACTINAVFKPTVAGALKTAILINAGSAGTESVALTGTGVAP